MKAICIPAKGRPTRLKQLVASLDKAGLGGVGGGEHWYRLFVGVEPGDETLNRVCLEYPSLGILYNSVTKGHGWNHYSIAQHAFDSYGVKMVVILEADTLVSSDLLDLCTWFFERRDEYYGMSLLSPIFEDGYRRRKEGMVEVGFVSRFGMVYGRESWYNLVQPGWMYNKQGWDAPRVNDVFYSKKKVLSPEISRIIHPGGVDSCILSEEESNDIFYGDVFFEKDIGDARPLAYSISRPAGSVTRR